MKQGFSLVELSIVLVILGLLTGGILAGQSLIRAAELRAVSSEYNRYTIAMRAFRDKYFALPGDMPNAVRFWGAQAGATTDGADATCAALTTSATSSATCNGDGNGQISDASYTGSNAYEAYRYWQHLANAGLIEGQYSGVYSSLANKFYPVPGTNSGASKLGNAGYRMYYLGTFSNGAYFSSDYGHILELSAWPSFSGVLKPEEAWNLDTKMDDGIPSSGIVMAYNGAATCASSTQYALSNTGKNCSLILKTKM